MNGIIRLSESLAVVQERLSKLIDECNCETSDTLNPAAKPDHRSWIVTLAFWRGRFNIYTRKILRKLGSRTACIDHCIY
jgi:hypothetical protein